MTKVSVNAPRTPVTEGSSGIAAATLPNVCKMPGPPAPFVPTPLPNIGKSGTSPKGYSKTVTIEGKKVAIKGASFGSMGDVASKGTGGGLISSNVEGPTSFVGPGSMDVKIEGKNVQLLGDPMFNNCGPSGNPANAATMMGVIQATGLVTVVDGKDACPLCKKAHGKGGEVKETQSTKAQAGRLAKKFAQKVTPKLSSNELPSPLQTMLGVLQCKCKSTIYADRSGVTCQELRDSVDDLKWYRLQDGATAINSKAKTLKFLVTRFEKHKDEIQKTWIKADRRSAESNRRRQKSEKSAASYPPGSCAGPKALVLALDDEAIPASLTERFFHSKGEAMGALIRFRDGVSGEEVEESFSNGKTVPPCGTCNLIIPLMLCSDSKEMECRHKNKK